GRARARRLALKITGRAEQYELFEATGTAAEPIAVRLDRVRVERGRRFGDVWLGWVLWRALDLDRFCSEHLIAGREQVAWSAMAAILVIARLCEPSSALHIAEDWYRRTALDDLLGVPAERVNDDRLACAGSPAAAQGGAGGALEGAAGRAVRSRLRAFAVRRDEHLLRGSGRGQHAGQARLQ